jgi:ribonuclease BN (tRNA processing enzyme)
LGFLIHHPESGVILFLTDSYFSTYKFDGVALNNVIIEANYDQVILDRKMEGGEEPRFLRDRVVQSHMSLETCKGILVANDLSAVHHIVLIHLSDRNSDEVAFTKEIRELTGKTVTVARPGLTIPNFNKTPF